MFASLCRSEVPLPEERDSGSQPGPAGPRQPVHPRKNKATWNGVCYIRGAETKEKAMRRRLSLVLAVSALLAVPCLAQIAANAPAVPAERMVVVFGQTIHYWDVGSGPVVVLLHGLGDRKESWLAVIPPLSKKYRVLVPDQIGFGKSDKPLLDYSIQTYVDFLNEFLHDLKVEAASLVGESLGGWISGLYAAESSANQHMVSLEKLVLVDAAGLKQDRAAPNLNPSTLAEMRQVLELVFYDTSWLDDSTLHRIFTDKLAANDGYTVHSIVSNPTVRTQLLDDRLGEIRVPTLVVWGKQDQLIPVARGERYASGIAGARIVTFDKCGHVPAEEHTAEFLTAVTDFLSGGSETR
jgi:pimeloyl-ACP methyl ester carboxylesterase